MFLSSGADKQLENDEPLFCYSSSSDEEDQGERRDDGEGLVEKDIAEHVQELSISSERSRVNPRKRPAVGHTPFDLANCQKVRYAEESTVTVIVYAGVSLYSRLAILTPLSYTG